MANLMKAVRNTTMAVTIMAVGAFSALSQGLRNSDLPKVPLDSGRFEKRCDFSYQNGKFAGFYALTGAAGTEGVRLDSAAFGRNITFVKDGTINLFCCDSAGAEYYMRSLRTTPGGYSMTLEAVDPFNKYASMILDNGQTVQLFDNRGCKPIGEYSDFKAYIQKGEGSDIVVTFAVSLGGKVMGPDSALCLPTGERRIAAGDEEFAMNYLTLESKAATQRIRVADTKTRDSPAEYTYKDTVISRVVELTAVYKDPYPASVCKSYLTTWLAGSDTMLIDNRVIFDIDGRKNWMLMDSAQTGLPSAYYANYSGATPRKPSYNFCSPIRIRAPEAYIYSNQIGDGPTIPFYYSGQWLFSTHYSPGALLMLNNQFEFGTTYTADTVHPGSRFQLQAVDERTLWIEDQMAKKAKTYFPLFRTTPYIRQDTIQTSVDDSRTRTAAFEIYPNPADGQVTVRLADADEKTHQVVIYDVLGIPRARGEMRGGQAVFDVSSLPSGVYRLEVDRQGRMMVKQ